MKSVINAFMILVIVFGCLGSANTTLAATSTTPVPTQPSGEGTPSVTPTPTADWPYPPPVQTQEPTAVVPTPQPTATPQPSPTISPTPEPSVLPGCHSNSAQIGLRVDAEPAIFIPGKSITFSWKVCGYNRIKDADPQLVFSLPEGVSPRNSALAQQITSERKLAHPAVLAITSKTQFL